MSSLRGGHGLLMLCIYFFTRTGLVLLLAHALLQNEVLDGYS
jgi:hypothetical protein